MAEETPDGQGSSQDEAFAEQLAAFKEELLGDVKTLIEAKGKDDGDEDKPDKPDASENGKDEAPGWFMRLLGKGKREPDNDDQDKGADKTKPDEASQRPPETPVADQAPPWAIALAQEVQGLKDSVGRGASAKRSEVLDGLHVMPKARQLVPDFDPLTDEGLADAEKWASENPEFLTVRVVKMPTADDSLIPKGGFTGADESAVKGQLGKLAAQGAEIQRRWEAQNS